MERKNTDAPQFRSVSFERKAVNADARSIEFALASELPYQRWWGIEVLSLEGSAVRLGRLASGTHPLLVDHNTRDQVGVIEKAWIDGDKVLRCIARFGNSARANEIFQDVKDGIRSLVSVGYQIHSLRLLKASDDEDDTYLVDDWEPFEGSIVAVPADPTVGIGREESADTHLRSLINSAKEKAAMDPKDNAAGSAGNKDNAGGSAGNAGNGASGGTVPPQPKDHAEVVRNATAMERQRTRDIEALGRKFNRPQAEIDAAIDGGTGYDAFREKVFTALQESGKLALADSGKIGMTDKDVRNFSFCRLLAAAMFPNERGLQEAAAFEIEASQAAQDHRQDTRTDRRGALCIPVDVMVKPMDMRLADAEMVTRMLMNRLTMGGRLGRDLVVGTATAGGNLVATELLASSFIDLLTNSLVLGRAGATILSDLQGNVAIPRATGGATTYWVAENTNLTESQQAFDQVALTPKTVGAFCDYSRRLLLQASTAVEAFVRMDIARQIALAIDLAGLNGSGASNQPRGVLNTVGIGSVAGGTNGAQPTWGNIVDLESAVANANAPEGNRAYVTNTRMRGRLKQTQKFTGTNGQEVWTGQGEMNGTPAFVSNQIPSNLTKGTSVGVCSALAYGNWADLLIGLWGGLDVLFDPYTGGIAGTKRLVALQDVDASVRYPVSFAAMLDALP
jgi:HK97 family phage major capsid protein